MRNNHRAKKTDKVSNECHHPIGPIFNARIKSIIQKLKLLIMPSIVEIAFGENVSTHFAAWTCSIQNDELKYNRIKRHSNHATINNDSSDKITMMGQQDLCSPGIDKCNNGRRDECLVAHCSFDSDQNDEVKQTSRK